MDVTVDADSVASRITADAGLDAMERLAALELVFDRELSALIAGLVD